MLSDVVRADDNLSLNSSTVEPATNDGAPVRSTESRGDLVGGVDAADVRSLDDPFFDWPICVCTWDAAFSSASFSRFMAAALLRSCKRISRPN